MDLENQKRVKEFAEQYGPENIVVLLGAAEGEASGLAAETVTAGDPTFAGPLTGVSLGLTVYHICEPEIKAEVDEQVYEDQISMMEMVLDVDDIVNEMSSIREQYCKYHHFLCLSYDGKVRGERLWGYIAAAENSIPFMKDPFP